MDVQQFSVSFVLATFHLIAFATDFCQFRSVSLPASHFAFCGFCSVKVGMQRFDSDVAASGQSIVGDVETGHGDGETGHAETFEDDSYVEPGLPDETNNGDFPLFSLPVPSGDEFPAELHVDDDGNSPGPPLSDAAANAFSFLQQQDSGSSSSFQPVVSRAVHEATFARNLFSNVDVTGIKLPWEVGIFGDIFSDEPFATGLIPKMPVSEFCNFDLGVAPQEVVRTVASLAMHDTSNPVFSACISSGDDLHYQEKRQRLRDTAIGKIFIVLQHNLNASSTGQHISELFQREGSQEGALEIIDSVVGVKSPATLVKRANSMLAFLRWCDLTGRCESNCFQEHVLWDYFRCLKDSGAAASKADSMMSAVRFAVFVLGFDCLRRAVNSRRLIGASELMLTGKRLLRQALVLTSAQIIRLHNNLVDTDRHLMDRVLVAHLLFALYGRCRNSDLLALHTIECDFDSKGGFVILTTCNHKSGRLASLKTRLLPIIIPARGVDGSIWPGKALEVLELAGCSIQNPIDGPLVHAPAGGVGVFMNRGLRSSEVSKALRSFLGIAEPEPGFDGEIVSSHSLKATLLAWSARYGLTPQTRSLLGRHTSCLNETFSIYSRDLACAPVAELQKVIDCVADGTFSPDAERSMFFRERIGIPSEEPHQCVKQEVVVEDDFIVIPDSPDAFTTDAVGNTCESTGNQEQMDDSCAGEALVSDSDSSSSSSAASSDDPETAAAQPRVKRFRARIPDREEWFVHSKSHLVHRFNGDSHNDVKFLVCGKRLTDSYSRCTEATAWNTLCKSCNRK